MKEKLIAHEFPVWQDPQCDPIIEFISDSLFYYFKCWNEENPPENENYLGLFSCKRVQRIKYLNPFEKYPYIEECNFRCYFYELKNSSWLDDWYKIKTEREPNWQKYDLNDYKHFILMTRESYLEIISSGIAFQKVERHKTKMTLWNKL